MESLGEIVSIYIMPNIGLDVSVEYDGEGAGSFVVNGPKQKLDALMHVVQGLPGVDQIKGVVGPMTAVTLPDDIKLQAGIPLPATQFAFLHPLKYFKSRQHRINLVINPWSCVHLLGGFAYFDDDGKLLGVNALTIQPTASVLHLVGPTAPTSEVVQAMRDLGRMTDVVIEGLLDAGFQKFGWINPGETPRGETVALLNPQVVMHGGFLYEADTGPVVYAITPVADPDNPLDTNGKLGTAMVELRKIIIADDREAKRLRDSKSANADLAKLIVKAFLSLTVYLAVGCAFMCTIEGWTILDAIYWSMVSMSTVGYGDLNASKPQSRGFTVVFIYFGIIAIFSRLSAVVSHLSRPFITWGRKKLKQVLPEHLQARHGGSSKKLDKSKSTEEAEATSATLFYFQNMLPSLFLTLVLQTLSALVFTYIEGWDYGLALYHCLVTASTVGYGDPEIGKGIPEGQFKPGRVWASIHILLSVALLGDTISIIDELRIERRKELKRIQALNRKLDRPLLDNLNMRSAALRPDVNKTDDGITELEFVIGMCVELDMIDMDQIKPFIDQFRRLDILGSGRVGMKDLRLQANNMGNLARLRRRQTVVTPRKKAPTPRAQTLQDKQWSLALAGSRLRVGADKGDTSPVGSQGRSRPSLEESSEILDDVVSLWGHATHAPHSRKGILNKLTRLKGSGGPKIGPKASEPPVAVPYPVSKPFDPAWKPLRAAVKLTSLSSSVSAFSSTSMAAVAAGATSSSSAPNAQPHTSTEVEELQDDELTKVTPF